VNPMSSLTFAILFPLLVAGCGGLQKPSSSTSVNAPTFPQPQVAPPPAPTEGVTQLPPLPAENSAFVMTAGVPQYRIGPGDILDIVVTRGSVQDKIQTVVRPTGSVMVILAEVKVDGLTTDQAATVITQELSVFFRRPTVDVQIKEYNSKKVTLLGAIGGQTRASASTIPLTGRVTLVEAIAKAGGFQPNASLDRIRVSRASGKTYTVNVLRFVQDGDLSQEFVLDAGDTVFVPEQVKGEERRVFLLGEVKTPGPAPYFPNLTLGQLVAQVGGWTDAARYDQAAIIRSAAGVTEILTVDLRRLLLDGEKRIDQYLKPNDVVFVPRTPVANWNAFIGQIRPTFDLMNQPLYTILSIKALKEF
jgi:protein involved in polysaccharide export with SLBB domain